MKENNTVFGLYNLTGRINIERIKMHIQFDRWNSLSSLVPFVNPLEMTLMAFGSFELRIELNQYLFEMRLVDVEMVIC